MFGSYSLCLWYGAKLVEDGEYTGGQVVNVFFAVLIGGIGLAQVSPGFESLAKGQGSAYRIFETMDRPSKIDPFNFEGEKLENVTGKIEFKNVIFRYPTRFKTSVFDRLNLTIEPGKTTALVGSSGSGKSSALSLILRFYDPLNGTISIDGVDIKSLNLKGLRSQV